MSEKEEKAECGADFCSYGRASRENCAHCQELPVWYFDKAGEPSESWAERNKPIWMTFLLTGIAVAISILVALFFGTVTGK